MIFKTPLVLLLIPFLLGFAIYRQRRQRTVSVRFPTVLPAQKLAPTWRLRSRNLPDILRLMVLTLLLTALAGPRSVLEKTFHKGEGIDIVVTVDDSGSMAGEDFIENGQRINRLAIVKKVVKEFVDGRTEDRLGLVVFSAVAYSVCPLTTDHQWLKANLDRIELGQIQDGTAIGSAIMSAVARLEKSRAKSKVIILLTDGMNNAGEIAPLTAAKAARALGIKIYAIGAGTNGLVPFPAVDFFGRKVYQQVQINVDEQTLSQIAEETGAKFFRATDTESLRKIYHEIDLLEKTEIEQVGYRNYKELFVYLLAAALCLLTAEIILARTLYLQIP
ncbi:MAG: VWA domain-containing protein [Candidatus Omnitrophica bacterium]|nr:VWA domain-containing protein [Candidatus Omnitrophota bacterium]